MPTCPACNAILKTEAKFCPQCGKKMDVCKSCGLLLNIEDKFCQECGEEVKGRLLTQQPAAIIIPSTLIKTRRSIWVLIGIIITTLTLLILTVAFLPTNTRKVEKTYQTERKKLGQRYEKEYGTHPPNYVYEMWEASVADKTKNAKKLAEELDERYKTRLAITLVFGLPLLIFFKLCGVVENIRIKHRLKN